MAKTIIRQTSTQRTQRRRNAQDRNEPGSGAAKKMVAGMKAPRLKIGPVKTSAAGKPTSNFPARPGTVSPNTRNKPAIDKQAAPTKKAVVKTAKKAVKAAKKTVKAAAKTVKTVAKKKLTLTRPVSERARSAQHRSMASYRSS